ncbi:lipoprotein [Breoghania sp.]|uniref:LPS translocon maturation chaperone LptM n=1 Tax=Breoghania sp. TaxID=2065378 RepID=UPI002AA6BC81|nr:lipoprotein [Breoghania sp.]
MSAVRSARLAVLVAAVVALTVSGCGRRGPLEAPSAERKPEATGMSVIVPGPSAERPSASKTPDRPFILDPLI